MHLIPSSRFCAAILVCALGGAAALGCRASATGEFNAGGEAKAEPPPAPPPPPDQDGDGILDADDKCANEAETKNDFEDEDGCPDEKPLAQLSGTQVRINQKIQFAHNSAAIEAESTPVIEAVAGLMKEHPEIELIEVSGHASNEGDANHNRQLTQKRVDSVVKALTERGIDKSRLIAQGYGFYCLLDEGTTPEAHEKNRRVEFKILQREGKPTDVTRGCEPAEKAGIKPKALTGAKVKMKSAPAAGAQ